MIMMMYMCVCMYDDIFTVIMFNHVENHMSSSVKMIELLLVLVV